jgi:hypothetical protein
MQARYTGCRGGAMPESGPNPNQNEPGFQLIFLVPSVHNPTLFRDDSAFEREDDG